MPFKYRLQKMVEFRIRKKEEQLQAVIKAQNEVRRIEGLIEQNNQAIIQTRKDMRTADPMMYETYDKYLIHLWDKARQLEEIRVQAQQKLDEEIAILAKLEQGVKVLEKHKEKNKELWLEEEKKAELKLYSEQGVVRFFRQKQEKLEEEDREILRQLEQIDK